VAAAQAESVAKAVGVEVVAAGMEVALWVVVGSECTARRKASEAGT